MRRWPMTLRIYYISHLGKYAPLGKGWALLLRVAQCVTAGVRAGTGSLNDGAAETGGVYCGWGAACWGAGCCCGGGCTTGG